MELKQSNFIILCVLMQRQMNKFSTKTYLGQSNCMFYNGHGKVQYLDSNSNFFKLNITTE